MRSWLQTIGMVLAVSLLLGADQPPGGLDIYFIDVLGGAATLVVTPERESILVDTGWRGFEDRDPKRIEHVLKNVAKLDHLDHLVTTHWHADHYGGVEGLAKRVRIERFWDRGLPDPNAPDNDKLAFPDGPKPDDPLGLAYRKASAGRRQTLKAGDSIPLKGSVSLLVLASGGKVIDAPTGSANAQCDAAPADLASDPSDNARSLAFRLRMGQFDFFDGGDLTWNIEKQLVCPVDRVGPIDLYQVTHHGLAISNHPTLLQTIAPTVTIMNNGPKKGGDAATVQRLKSIPSIKAAYQVHKNAATGTADNTDSSLIANSDLAGGQFIRVHVTPDGRQFRVGFGEEGATRTFDSR